MKKIVAVNSGSSSFKFKIFDMPSEIIIASGQIEKIGHEDSIFTIVFNAKSIKKILPIDNHKQAVELFFDALFEHKIISNYNDIFGVGHRVAQGGIEFKKSELFDDYVKQKLIELTPLAPLHNPANIIVYDAFKQVCNIPQVAVFDTAFHHTIKKEDYIYAIPYKYYKKYGIRRYGFHGTSHRYLSQRANNYLRKDSKIIICHLGSGSSIAAIKNGKSVATSMGFTPLVGVIMGTRSGDIDPSILTFLAEHEKTSTDKIIDILYKESGLLGISELSNDARDLQLAYEESHKKARLAIDLWARSIANYIGQYFIRLGGLDAIIFSGGIGENSPFYRKKVINLIKNSLQIEIDDTLNESCQKEKVISTPKSKVKIIVIPTDEELMIAKDTYQIVSKLIYNHND